MAPQMMTEQDTHLIVTALVILKKGLEEGHLATTNGKTPEATIEHCDHVINLLTTER